MMKKKNRKMMKIGSLNNQIINPVDRTKKIVKPRTERKTRLEKRKINKKIQVLSRINY